MTKQTDIKMYIPNGAVSEDMEESLIREIINDNLIVYTFDPEKGLDSAKPFRRPHGRSHQRRSKVRREYDREGYGDGGYNIGESQGRRFQENRRKGILP